MRGEIMENLFKQPNGKYCSVNWRGELELFNRTEQEIIDMYIEKAKDIIKNAEQSEEIIKEIAHSESRGNQRAISDVQLEIMGFNKPYNEMAKYIPRKPINKNYASCDFATYAQCPNCSGRVQDGMGHTDETCPYCNQILKWKE